MPRSEKPQNNTPQSILTSSTKRYVLRPVLHPNDWKLELKDSSGQTIYEVLRRLTKPIRYYIQTNQIQESHPIIIKTMTIGNIQRYTLFEGGQSKLSLRQSTSSALVLLQDPKRKIIAHFLSITPEIALLRTQTKIIGRLRFKENPTPVGFIVECQVQPELKWLYAILLYVIAQIETLGPSTQVEEIPEIKPENNASEATSP